ncbi:MULTISPECIES: PaaI family thioesterase [Actinoalloteichus]|nr:MULTISPECIES: PaaI family thioesterase [Actinoalloteichus]
MHREDAVPSGLELLRAARGHETSAGIGLLLGMRFEDIEDGRLTLRCRTRSQFANPLGTLHGGILATLLDSAMGCAVHTTLPGGIGYTSVDLAVKFLRPGSIDDVELLAEGRVVHRGRRTSTAEGTVHDAAGRLLATGTTTCLILRDD